MKNLEGIAITANCTECDCSVKFTHSPDSGLKLPQTSSLQRVLFCRARLLSYFLGASMRLPGPPKLYARSIQHEVR